MIDYHTTLCPDCHGERVAPNNSQTYRQCDTCEGTGSVVVPVEVDYIPMWAIIVLAAFMGVTVAILILMGFHI